MEDKFCPCCGRHCSLDDPHCGRGVAFAQTGEIPSEGGGRDRGGHCDHGGDHEHRGGHCGDHGGHGMGHCARKERYDAMDADNKLICNIRDLGHTVRFLSDGKAGQNRILIILNEGEPITQSELTDRLGVQSGTASEVIGKLEKAGLIERVTSEKDKRTCELKLTEDGAAKAEQAGAERKSRYAEMFGCLTDEERETLLGLLEKVNSDWRGRYGEGREGRRNCGDNHGRDHGCRCDTDHEHGHDHDHGHWHGHRHGDRFGDKHFE